MFNQMNIPQPSPQIVVSKNIPDILRACKAVTMFKDDRDRVLTRLNCYLASIGTGKGYYEHGKCVVFPRNNLFQVFKGICYNLVDLKKPSEGEISLLFSLPADQIADNVENVLSSIIASSTGVSLLVLSVEEVSHTSTMVTFECRNGNQLISADTVLQRINGTASLAQQLKNMSVYSCFRSRGITEDDVHAHNSRPHEGFSNFQWKEALQRNPQKSRIILASIFSPAELSRRAFLQKKRTELHCQRISSVENRVKSINQALYLANSSLSSLMERKDRLTGRLSRIVSRLSTREPPEHVTAKLKQSYHLVNNADNFQVPIEELRVNVSRTPVPVGEMDHSLANSLSVQCTKMEELVEYANLLGRRVVQMEMCSAAGGLKQTHFQ